jgi:hypothetical protein
MKKMLFGFTEAEYLEGYTSAIASMKNQESKYTEYLKKWHSNRDKFAKHITSNLPGSLWRHGSSHAEQNHSSFVQRIGPVCLDDSATAISAIFRQHADISSKRNLEITRYDLSVASRVQTMNMDSTDIQAVNFLSSWGFELWQEMRNEAMNYQVEHVSEGIARVTCIGLCNAKPRILSTINGCNCQQKVALRIQCPHETDMYTGQFLPTLWNHCRWRQRSKFTLSNHVPHSHDAQSEDIPALEAPLPNHEYNDAEDASIEMQMQPRIQQDEMHSTTQESFFRNSPMMSLSIVIKRFITQNQELLKPKSRMLCLSGLPANLWKSP